MNYWLDLFTGTTWEEFRKAGATVSGFRHRMRGTAKKIAPGDILLCYLTGVMRWIGALEVIGPSKDRSAIWTMDKFSVRLAVKPLVVLDPEFGVLMKDLEGRLAFYAGPKDRGGFKGFLRMSPNRFRRPADGELILKLLRDAEQHPVASPVNPRKLARKPYYKVEFKKGTTAVEAVVTVPEPEPEAPAPGETTGPTTRHTEIQYYLLKLGAELGLDVWVARNDRQKMHDGQALGSLPRMLSVIPTQFNDATTRTIELIDVLWLRGNSIIAAFEVEATTSIYSGLLRMSDLLALQPNLDIQLFLVAPEDRRDKVEQEIGRPTFAKGERPLPKVCGFLAFDKLVETVKAIRKLGLTRDLNASFLKRQAEYFQGESSSRTTDAE